MDEGRVNFDWMAVSIGSHTLFDDGKVLRGKFLDRNKVVLGKSIYRNNRTVSNQERFYTQGPGFYPVIGYWNFIYGKNNLEKEMDEYLRGNHHFPVYSRLPGSRDKVEIGDDVVLTLDSKIQRVAYNLMRNRRGAVVVLKVQTGEILAAVSAPSFDPNKTERNYWREAFADHKGKPYENRAFSVLYPPGSTFKTVVASAWLEEDRKEELQEIVCTGEKNKYNISDIHAHGKVNLDKAFTDSCNLFFSEIGVMLGPKLLDYAERFGFNQDLNLIPQIKRHDDKAEKSLAFSWYDYSSDQPEVRTYTEDDFKKNPKIVAQGAIGQNLIVATPLQMALVSLTIANEGKVLNPYLIKEITRGDGKKVIFSSHPVEMGRAIKKSTAMKLATLMKKVMEKGTGKHVKKLSCQNGTFFTVRPGKTARLIPIAGKTGTAEVGDKNGNGNRDPDEKPHSWFIGFAPADNPQVSIAVIVENQGFGSMAAAPIAMDVLAEALNQTKGGGK